MAELPAGTLTFLFTDHEGSTGNWERDPMRDTVARHDELFAETVVTNDGQVVKTTGDGLAAVLAKAADGVAAALACKQAMGAEEWAAALRARTPNERPQATTGACRRRAPYRG
jgi:class 3 adenylate cyclase